MDPVHKLRSTRLVEYGFAPIPLRNSAPFCETFRDFWHKCGTMYRIVPLSRVFITPCRNMPYDFQNAAVPEIPGTFTPCTLAAACPHSEGLPARRRRVNLRLAGEPQAGHREKNFRFSFASYSTDRPETRARRGNKLYPVQLFSPFPPSTFLRSDTSFHASYTAICVLYPVKMRSSSTF